MEYLTKYIYGNARIFVVQLKEAVMQTVRMQSLSESDGILIGKLEAFAACLAGLQKEDGASVSVKLTDPAAKKAVTALAEKSGQVRAYLDEIADAVRNSEPVMEVVQRLPLRGNYTGVVSAPDLDCLIRAYFARSLQIEAVCRVFSQNSVFYCVLVEQLPGIPMALKGVMARALVLLENEMEFPEDEFERMEQTPLFFGCTCSRASVYRLIRSMTPDELAELTQDGKIETHCKFCGKKYSFEV